MIWFSITVMEYRPTAKLESAYRCCHRSRDIPLAIQDILHRSQNGRLCVYGGRNCSPPYKKLFGVAAGGDLVTESIELIRIGDRAVRVRQ